MAPVQDLKLKKSKFIVTFWKDPKNVEVKITDWIHIQGISAVSRGHLSKVNGKQFLRSGPHKVAPIQVMKLKNLSFSGPFGKVTKMSWSI